MIKDKEIIFNILRGEKNSIPYRPEIAREIGVIPAIILQQMIYRWSGEKFYKFTEPSKNEKYREGDSWTEELGLTKFEFTNNLKKIAFKLGKNKNEIKKENALIIYYTDSNRLTWYTLKLDNINKLLNNCYNLNYLVSEETGFTKESKETANTNNIYYNTENNSENTTEKKEENSHSLNLELLQLKKEGKDYVNIWNKIFGTNYSFTETLFNEWKKLRKKYSKDILEKGLNNYLETKKKRDGQDFKTKYTMTALAFLKNKINGIVSYL